MATKPTSSSNKLQVTGAILLVCSIFGITEIIFHTITEMLLGDPAVNTTGRAIVNISTLGSGALGILLGVSLFIVGTARRSKHPKV